MAIKRRLGPAQLVAMVTPHAALYECTLTTVASPAWRAAFLRPPPRLMTMQYTPDLGRVGLTSGTIHFRTIPARARFWLKRIDRWIEYANSVVEE
jgi:hypothetical protein